MLFDFQSYEGARPGDGAWCNVSRLIGRDGSGVIIVHAMEEVDALEVRSDAIFIHEQKLLGRIEE